MKLNSYNYSTPTKVTINVDKFNGGVNVIQSDTRIRPEESSEFLNLMLVDDGLPSPRWGTKTYGGEIVGAKRIDGFSEYIASNGTRELIVIANGVVQKKTGNSWTIINGATFTAGKQVYCIQIAGRLYITNGGYDPMAMYDGSSLTTYSSLNVPSNVVLNRGAGLSSGNYNYFVQITALNSIGETAGSIEVSTTVDIAREDWNEADEYIDISWDAISGATRYQIYVSDESGYECLLGESQTNSFRDDKTATINPYIEVPDDNTTAGPKLGPLTLSGNRMWGTKDPDNKYRVYFTGTGMNIGTFSPFYGGGFIDLEKGGRTQPQIVMDYRDGQGKPKATVLCSTPEGTGNVWQISLISVDVGDTSFIIPSPEKVTGSTGTNAPLSAVIAKNDIYFLNKRGVDVLGNEKQYWGVLRTNELSVKIRPYITSILGSYIDKACAYYFDDKIFFSVCTDGTENNRIFLYDREHKVFLKDWSIGVTQFGEFTDEYGVTHFLGGSTYDGYMIEFSENILGDRGVAFRTRYRGPRFSMSRDWSKFARLRIAKFRFEEPKGAVNISLIGTGRRKSFSTIATGVLTTSQSLTGLGFDLIGKVILGDTKGIPKTFSSKNTQRNIRLRYRVRDIQVQIETTGLENGYKLHSYRIEGHVLNIKDTSDERL